MLNALKENAAVLAGGTDLLVKMKSRDLSPAHIVSLTDLEELNQIDVENGKASIGSGCTIARIAESKKIRLNFPALAFGAGQLGSPAVRNLGTIGGNVVTASPAADLPPALAAYGAEVRLKCESRERYMAIEKCFNGPGLTNLEKNEILAEFHMKIPPECSGAGFFKLGHRKALQCAIINGACYLSLDSRTGVIENARVVLGAVAPKLVRSLSAENILRGEKPGETLFAEAGKAAVRDCNPIDDLRGSASYRREMIEVMTLRTLRACLEEIHKTFPGI
jgi:carbon-monoxide dehydrogenase medium subunit